MNRTTAVVVLVLLGLTSWAEARSPASPGPRNAQVSYVDGEPRVLVPGHEYVDFRASGLDRRLAVYPETQIHRTEGRVCANQWKYADWEADGDLDLIVGVGDWTGYGWDDAFDAKGEWARGPLRGVVYLILNRVADPPPMSHDTTRRPRSRPATSTSCAGSSSTASAILRTSAIGNTRGTRSRASSKTTAA